MEGSKSNQRPRGVRTASRLSRVGITPVAQEDQQRASNSYVQERLVLGGGNISVVQKGRGLKAGCRGDSERVSCNCEIARYYS